MPFVENDKVRIHYEIEGKGKCLVLHHGFYGSLEDWYEYGYVDALKDDYTIIMLDARGFGKSGKPHEASAYLPELRAGDVIKVLDKEGIDSCYYMGYSMGGWIAYSLMDKYTDRFDAFILNGIHPYENNMLLMQEAIRTMETWVPQRKISKAAEKRFLENDREALMAAASDIRRDNTKSLMDVRVPCLIMDGEEDPIFDKVKQSGKLSVMTSFTAIPGEDHSGSLCRSDLVVPIIRSFLSKLAAENMDSK